MIIPFMQGFGMGGGLIVAIGAQNAFVLSHSLRRTYYLLIPLICFLCDAILISVGIAGVGTAVATSPFLARMATWGGAAFLFCYGLRAFRSALQGGSLSSDGESVCSLSSAIWTTLAVTLLNPHVYLDTVVLLGSISSQFAGTERIIFGAGAVVSSFIWFFSLGLGGRILAPLFKQPVAWRIMDSVICITMWIIAGSLLMSK